MAEQSNRTTVSFVSGLDDATPIPDAVKSAELNHRFAIIQDTCRPDSVDMYFDEKLWRSLVNFTRQFNTSAQVSVIEEGGRDEKSLDAFMSYWDKSTEPYRDPPPFIFVRDERDIGLIIATEYWTRVGGPMPYADSYTYSIFSREDVGERVVNFLLDCDRQHCWELITPVLQGQK